MKMKKEVLVVVMLMNLINYGSSQTVSIGKQVWMTKNLDVDTFRNGDPIPQAKTAEEWDKANEKEQPAWCYYDNDPANGAKYGKLYNWYAVNDSRGLAPVGFHIPTDSEWTKLEDFLEPDSGVKMKSKNGWKNDGNGTNESSFSGLPGGYRFSGTFNGIGEYGYWWSSTEYFFTFITRYRVLNYVGSFVDGFSPFKDEGLSVRCLRD